MREEDVLDLLVGEDEADFDEDFYIDFLATGHDRAPRTEVL